jgi:hypothetical protein
MNKITRPYLKIGIGPAFVYFYQCPSRPNLKDFLIKYSKENKNFLIEVFL